MFVIKKGSDTICQELKLDLRLSWNSSYEIFDHKNPSRTLPHVFHV